MSEQQQGAAGDLLNLNLDELVAATDRTILALLAEWEEPITAPMYEQIRYHLGYADPAARPGKRMRPLLGLLGTLSGLVAIFAEIGGSGDPIIVARGISEALR